MCKPFEKRTLKPFLELFEQMLMAGFKTIENKSLEWKHTNNNTRKDWQVQQWKLIFLSWLLSRIKPTYEGAHFFFHQRLRLARK